MEMDYTMHPQAHVAGLKRLSARATKGPAPTTDPRKVCFSFAPLARDVINFLRECQVQIVKGLSDVEFANIEATFDLTFPPDLKAILQEGLPISSGFPNWRSESLQQLSMRLDLPTAGLCYEVSRRRFWTKQWGLKPPVTEKAVRLARAALKKVPTLIPIFDHYYIPSSPELAGNPVFSIHQNRVFIYAYDLTDFFDKQTFAPYRQQAPSKFANIEMIGGKTGGLDSIADWDSGNGRIYRFEKSTANGIKEDSVDLRSCRDVGNGGDLEEKSKPFEWNCKESSLAWEKNLDSLARSDDYQLKLEERLRSHVEELPNQRVLRFFPLFHNSAGNSPRLVQDDICSPKSVQKRSTSINSSLDFSTKAGSQAARVARWIEFWSGLAHETENIYGSYCSSAERLYCLSNMHADMPQVSFKEDKCSEPTLPKLPDGCFPKWLASFLEEMALILYRGGWRVEDIVESLSVAPSPDQEQRAIFADKQSMLEEVALHVNSLSDYLRREGWTVEEISEAFDVVQDGRRRCYKVPSRLSARIAELVEYVAKP